MRYRLDVVAPTVLDAVKYAGGWVYDRAMAGWDVTVLIANPGDVRPLHILGAETLDLDSVLNAWEDRPHPQTVAVAADLFDRDPRVLDHVRNALDQSATEVTVWGERLPAELDSSVDSVEQARIRCVEVDHRIDEATLQPRPVVHRLRRVGLHRSTSVEQE